MSDTSTRYLVADAFLEALAEVSETPFFFPLHVDLCDPEKTAYVTSNDTQAGVDYLFTVLGSDHPSIIEAYVRRTKLQGKEFPRMILFQHEVRLSRYFTWFSAFRKKSIVSALEYTSWNGSNKK